MSDNECPHWVEIQKTLKSVDLLKILLQKIKEVNIIRCVECGSTSNDELMLCMQCSPRIYCNKCYLHNNTHTLYITNQPQTRMHCTSCSIDIHDTKSNLKVILLEAFRFFLECDSINLTTLIRKYMLTVQPTTSYIDNKEGGLVGLSNLGNTCFFNAVMQCLLHCPQLIASFVSIEDELSCKNNQLALTDEDRSSYIKTAEEKAKETLCINFATLVKKAWSGKYSVCVPKDVLYSICDIHPYFRGSNQHDAQELSTFFLDSLHEGLKIRYEYDHSIPFPSDYPHNLPKLKKHSSLIGTSIIKDMFHGTFCSTIRCSNCNYISKKTDPFSDMSLELPKSDQLRRIAEERGIEATQLPPEDELSLASKRGWFTSIFEYVGISEPPISIYTCLHSFCTSSELSSDNKYKCDKCTEKVLATKHIAIEKFPEILTFQIKRFRYGFQFGNKLTQHVEFPVNDLDMSSFEIDKEEKKSTRGLLTKGSKKYNLFAMIKHIGGSNNIGHYVSYAKHHITNKWYLFDDRNVREASIDELRQQEAYILYYRRQTNRILRNQLLLLLDNILKKQAEFYTSPKTDLVLLSQRWIRKIKYFSTARKIDNRDLCCPHGYPSIHLSTSKKNEDDSKDTSINDIQNNDNVTNDRYLYMNAHDYYMLCHDIDGGGPCIPGEITEIMMKTCQLCKIPIIRQEEHQKISNLDKQGSVDDNYYIIESKWLEEWRSFILKNGTRPGPICNHLLVIDNDNDNMNNNDNDNMNNNDNDNSIDRKEIKIKDNLIKGTDYRALHQRIYLYLFNQYGGGPMIVTKQYDIYSKQVLDWKEGGDDNNDDEDEDDDNDIMEDDYDEKDNNNHHNVMDTSEEHM